MYMLYVAIAIGVVAGIVHQLMDRIKKNEAKALIRGAITGGVAAFLTYIAIPSADISTMGGTIYLTFFTAGYFADNVVLNTMDRNKVKIMSNGAVKNIEGDLIKDAEKGIENIEKDEINKIEKSGFSDIEKELGLDKAYNEEIKGNKVNNTETTSKTTTSGNTNNSEKDSKSGAENKQ